MVVPLLTVAYLLSSVHTSELMNETVFTHPFIRKCEVTEHFRQRRSIYSTTEPLYCPPCERLHCYKHRKKHISCKGGYSVGICGCCRVCAKVEGEQCGGEYNYLGKCDKGLVCDPQPPTDVTLLKDGMKTVHKVHRGICKKASRKKISNGQCKPKCDPEFCNKNPRAICSAKENAENVMHCQGDCQHTSCRACRFAERQKPCPACSINDFKCIRDFGRCTRKSICRTRRYPCGNLKPVKTAKSEFLCSVPECLS